MARSIYEAVFSMPFSEQGGADPHQRRPFLDGRFKVAGHAHGQLVHGNTRQVFGLNAIAQFP